MSASETKPASSAENSGPRFDLHVWGPVIALVALVLFGMSLNDNFLSAGNVTNVLARSSFIGIIGEAATECLPRRLVGGTEDEVDDLDGGVHDAQRLGLLREPHFEELLVQLSYYLLLAVRGGDLRGADPHRVVKAFKVLGLGLQTGPAELFHHRLHRA